ncbi:hypothetical protein F511_46765 [Dorcoceras hygrometricum]|uniref:Uncharacterized protein n=1 Tax=Dorcoceras hygrometricum TaxID=472368 RepID=A0A2Z6ZT93_9LAMI|nr:hypothetical protein F511_46765 [Dorcoceras hygrometricum]
MANRRKISSRSEESAAKQLTIYESWMSTAELNSNGENDKKPAKEKDTSTIPCRSAIEEILLDGENQSAVAEVNRTVHQQRENESEVKLSTIIRERAELQLTVLE